MNRSLKRPAVLPWRSRLLVASAVVIMTGGTSIFSFDLQRVLIHPGGPLAVTERLEKSAPELPSMLRQISGQSARGAWFSRQTVEKNPSESLKRQLLCVLPDSGADSSSLDYCAEFTKPNSLVLRLMGTPKNHRSPPA